MVRSQNGAANVQSGQVDAGRNINGASPPGPKRGRLGIRHRAKVPARIDGVSACPVCGLQIRDRSAARLGFCDRCREFTGMCTWHTPCTELGAAAWEITQGQVLSTIVLCREHDMQVRFGGTPWIVNAVPLDPVSSRRPRQSATGSRR